MSGTVLDWRKSLTQFQMLRNKALTKFPKKLYPQGGIDEEKKHEEQAKISHLVTEGMHIADYTHAHHTKKTAGYRETDRGG